MKRPVLRAQSRSRLIEIQRRTDTGEGSWGQPKDEWVFYSRRWANIKFATGMGFAANELPRADREASRSLASMRIGYCEDIRSGSMRVVHRGRVYDIVEVLPDEAGKRYVDLAVAVGLSEG